MTWARNIRRRFLVKGGVHPKSHKETASLMTVHGPDPEVVVIPLLQHTGALCEPTVEVNDRVLVGEKIGDSQEYVSAPVHSSVSGEVTGIATYPHQNGKDVLSVRILSDGLNEVHPGARPDGRPSDMSPLDIRRVVRDGGIVGMGGAAFPTHVKLAPPSDKPIEAVIINGAECEPYLTGDERLMIERSEEVLKGAAIIKRAVGAERIIVAIESRKHNAIHRMRDAASEQGTEVFILPTRYPQGAERTLVKIVTGREVPSRGLPSDVGVIVDNVGTAAAIHDLFYAGMPLVERVITVSGDGVAGRANLRVKIGTLVKDIIDFCGGFVGERGKLIMGGPMMGLAQYTADVPVVKGTTGIVVLRGENLFTREPQHFICIRCGRCVRRCPMNLMPYLMGSYADIGKWEGLNALNIDDCIECGCCAYVCPTKNPLVQLVKVGKEGLARKRKKDEAMAGSKER